MKESQDHEVGMAMGQLEAMLKAIQELEGKIAKDGFKERDLPGWIQSHITSAYEYIKQANDNFHELGENVTPAAIGGMGPVQLPGNGTIGSGDFPAGQGDAKQEYKKKRKKMKHVKTFEAFSSVLVNEKYSSSDLKKLKEFAEEVADEISYDYEDEFDRKSSGLDADDFSADQMYDYIVDWGETNDMTAKEVMDEFNWKSLTQELGLA